jgi:hypothetical protein
MPWSTRFPDPVVLPGGGSAHTLREAGEFITRLPSDVQAEARWQTAMHVLIQAADHEGPLIFAQWGMTKALSDREPVYHAPSKDPKWRKIYKLARER